MKKYSNFETSQAKFRHVLISMYNSWKRGGVQMYVYNVLRTINLTGLEINIYISHEVEDLSFLDSLLKIPNSKITLYAGEGKKFHILNNIKCLISLMSLTNYDVIHVNTGNLFFQAVNLFLAKCFNIPFRVAHSHNAVVDLKSISRYKLVRIIKRISYKISRALINVNANHFFACSEVAGTWLFGKKVWKKRGELKKNGIILEDFSYDEDARNKIRNEYNIKKECSLIGLIANFNIQKNQSFLLNVFYEFSKKKEDSYLMLVGNGETKKNIENLVALRSIKNVIFVDSTNYANKFYSAFDIFVMTSLYEGLPFVAVEAQASGVSCLLSDSITTEIKMSPSLDFCSLQESYEVWCDKIKKNLDDSTFFNRLGVSQSNIKAIRDRGYDLKYSAMSIEQLYNVKVQNIRMGGGD